MLRTLKKRLMTLVLSVALLATPILAEDVTLDIEYIPITEDLFVATEMDGVPALYSLSSSQYVCSELIPRYYEAVYGLELRVGEGCIQVLNNSDVYFAQTETPQKGDIMFASAQARKKSYSHWSLVQSVDEETETVTCFEQNWGWNGQAGIDRVIPLDGCYAYYTMCSYSGNLPLALVAEEEVVEDVVELVFAVPTNMGLSTASDWAVPYLELAVQAGFADLSVDLTQPVDRTTFCQMAVSIATQQGFTVSGENALEQAQSLGLITNVETNTLSRQEAAVVASRLTDLIGDLPQANLDALVVYSDQDDIGTWAQEAVSQLTICGLMSGSSGAFQPTNTMTYEQAIVLMERIWENPAPTVTYSAAPVIEEVEEPLPQPLAEVPPVGSAAMDVVRLSAEYLFVAK